MGTLTRLEIRRKASVMNLLLRTMCFFWQNLSDMINSFISERSGRSFQRGTFLLLFFLKETDCVT